MGIRPNDAKIRMFSSIEGSLIYVHRLRLEDTIHQGYTHCACAIPCGQETNKIKLHRLER